MYTFRALTGQSRDSWLPVGGESTECAMTWALNGVESTLDIKSSLGFRFRFSGPNSRQARLTERACRSPTRLTYASANSWAVFNESVLRLDDCNGLQLGMIESASWSLQEVQSSCWSASTANTGIREESAKKGLCRWREEIWFAVAEQLII